MPGASSDRSGPGPSLPVRAHEWVPQGHEARVMTRIARPGDAFPNGLVGKVMSVMPKNIDSMNLDPENFTEYDGVHLALGTGI